MAEKMVTVNLRRSVGIRRAGATGAPTLYGPGIVEVPADVARSIGAKPLSSKGTRARTLEKMEADAEGQRDSQNEGGQEQEDPYKDFSREDFVAEAERRELTVTRADGKDSDPLISDFRAALEADDRERQR